MFSQLYELFVELDEHILALVEAHGGWAYGILFVLLACEVGLVVTPFLPGETLLFAAGAMAAFDALNLPILLVGFSIAATLGNISGYWIGRWFRLTVAEGRKIPFVNPANLEKTKLFFEQNPMHALIYSRFLPIIRALAPFVAGAACMPFGRFALYSFVGGTAWAVICTLGGYLFGQVPIVRDNFSLGVMVVVVLVCLPAVFSAVLRRRQPES